MVIRAFVVSVLLALLISCSGGEVITTCAESETHFSLRATNQGEFVNSVTFNVNAGIAFRGFDFFTSATDARKGVKIFYNSETQEFMVKTKRNERLLKGVDKQCVSELKAFLSAAKIILPIEILN